MRRLNLFLLLLLGFLIVTCAATCPVLAQQDFTAFFANPIDNTEIDGVIGSEWNGAGIYTDVDISPQGTAEIWTKQDSTYMYIAVRFTADSNNPWVAFLFGGTAALATGADGALFGNDNFTANGYSDVYFDDLTTISADALQNGNGGMTVDSSNVVTVELKKPFSSGDSAGKDIAWSEGNTYALIIMWNSNDYGASGGSVTYTDGPLIDKTIFFNSNTIPEFSSLMFTVFLVATTTSAFLLKKRRNAKLTASIS